MADWFRVTGYSIIGQFIGGKPYSPAANWKPGFGAPGDVPPVTLGVRVSVEYGPPDWGYPYTGLKLRLDYPAEVGSTPEVAFDPTDGYIEWSLQPGIPRVAVGSVTGVVLLGTSSGGSIEIDETDFYWRPTGTGCPTPPVAGGGSGGCPAGSVLSPIAPDLDGHFRTRYRFGGTPDPHGMGASLIWSSDDSSWGFAALPGNLTLANLGQTGESTPRDCWRATVPAADGSVRTYCNDSSTGEFVTCGPYGTSFASTENGWAETIGDSEVHYDVYGMLEKVVRGGSVHTYSRDPNGAWVDIAANTWPATKFRYALQGGVVQTVHQYAQLDGANWTEARQLAVSYGDGLITQVTSYPGGRTTSFSYDQAGKLASYEDCSGRTWALQYEGA